MPKKGDGMKFRVAIAERDGDVMEVYGSRCETDKEMVEAVSEQSAYMVGDDVSCRIVEIEIPEDAV